MTQGRRPALFPCRGAGHRHRPKVRVRRAIVETLDRLHRLPCRFKADGRDLKRGLARPALETQCRVELFGPVGVRARGSRQYEALRWPFRCIVLTGSGMEEDSEIPLRNWRRMRRSRFLSAVFPVFLLVFFTAGHLFGKNAAFIVFFLYAPPLMWGTRRCPACEKDFYGWFAYPWRGACANCGTKVGATQKARPH